MEEVRDYSLLNTHSAATLKRRRRVHATASPPPPDPGSPPIPSGSFSFARRSGRSFSFTSSSSVTSTASSDSSTSQSTLAALTTSLTASLRAAAPVWRPSSLFPLVTRAASIPLLHFLVVTLEDAATAAANNRLAVLSPRFRFAAMPLTLPRASAAPSTSPKEPCPLLDLSNEMLLHIIGYLDAPSVARFRATCTRANAIGLDNSIWLPLYTQEFRALPPSIRTVSSSSSRSGKKRKYVLPAPGAIAADYVASVIMMGNWNAGRATVIPLGSAGDRITGLAVSGSTLVTASLDHKLCVWDLPRQALAFTCRGHTAGITVLSPIVSGHYIVTGSADATLRRWSITTGRCTTLFTGHPAPVSAVHYSSSPSLVSGDTSGGVRVWDHESGDVLWVNDALHTMTVEGIWTGPESMVISCSLDGSVVARNYQEDRVVANWSHGSHHSHHVTSDPNRGIAVTGGCDGTVRVVALATDTVVTLTIPNNTPVATLHLDKKWLIAGAGAGFHVWSHDPDTEPPYVWTLRSSCRLPGANPNELATLTASSTGIVTGDVSGVFRTWTPPPQPTPLMELRAEQPIMASTSLSPNVHAHLAFPKVITAGGPMDRIRMWDYAAPPGPLRRWHAAALAALAEPRRQARTAALSTAAVVSWSWFVMPLLTLAISALLDGTAPPWVSWWLVCAIFLPYSIAYVVGSGFTYEPEPDSSASVVLTISGSTLLLVIFPAVAALRADSRLDCSWTFVYGLAVLACVSYLGSLGLDAYRNADRGLTFRADPVFWCLAGLAVVVLGAASVFLSYLGILADGWMAISMERLFAPLWIAHLIMSVCFFIVALIGHRSSIKSLFGWLDNGPAPDDENANVLEDFNPVVGNMGFVMLIGQALVAALEFNSYVCLQTMDPETGSCPGGWISVAVPLFLLEMMIAGLVLHLYR